MFAKIVILSLVAAATQAQVLGNGPCPNITVVQNFNVSAYLGQWYQISRFPNPFEKGDCSSALYGPVGEGGLVGVHNVEIVNGAESVKDGTAELADPNSTEAKLIVKFTDPDSVAPYWVIGTDYDNYTLIWSCEQIAQFNIQFSWVLARTKPLSKEAADTVEKLIATSGIDISKYQTHDLPECRNLP